MTDDFGRCLEAAISAEIAGGGSSYVLAALARFRDAVRAANTRVSAPAPVMESPSTKPVSDMSGAGAGVDLSQAMKWLRELADSGCEIERTLLSRIDALERDAERYRWIRQSKSDIEGPAAYAPWCGPPLFDAALDAAIDAAIDAARKEAKP